MDTLAGKKIEYKVEPPKPITKELPKKQPQKQPAASKGLKAQSASSMSNKRNLCSKPFLSKGTPSKTVKGKTMWYKVKSNPQPSYNELSDIVDGIDEVSLDEQNPTPDEQIAQPYTSKKRYKNFDNVILTLEESIKAYEERNTIYISVDMETFESNRRLLTEVGMAVHHPGIADKNIPPTTKAFHYIIKENIKHRNGRFVADHKFDFSYGISRVVSLTLCRLAFQSVISHCQKLAQEHSLGIAMVGHGFDSDMMVFANAGIHIPHEIDIIDTEQLWKVTQAKFSSLGKILKYLKIPHGLLHNAGNDAFLTLDLCLKLSDVSFRKLWRLDEGVTADRVVEISKVPSTSIECQSLEMAIDGLLD